jgi:hypothetical protein
MDNPTLPSDPHLKTTLRKQRNTTLLVTTVSLMVGFLWIAYSVSQVVQLESQKSKLTADIAPLKRQKEELETTKRELDVIIGKQKTEIKNREAEIAAALDRLATHKAPPVRVTPGTVAELRAGVTKADGAAAQLRGLVLTNDPKVKSTVDVAVSQIDELRAMISSVIAEMKPADPNVGPGETGRMQALIAQLFSSQAATRVKAYDELMDRYGTSTELIPNLIDYAESHSNNQNGIYNALVVLSHLDRAQMGPYRQRIKQFALAAQPMGDRIAQRVTTLLRRL